MKPSVEFPRMRIIIIAMAILAALGVASNLFVSSSQTEKSQDAAAARNGIGKSLEEEKEGDPREREKYWEMRRGGIPHRKIAEARDKAERLPQATALPLSSSTKGGKTKSNVGINAVTPGGSPWVSFGPAPISSGGATFSGRVPTIAVDPVDPNTIYAGGANGGVWKSTSGGSSWTSMNGENTAASLAMASIAINPTNHNIVYAGTGEPNGGSSHVGRGVLKTTNGGGSWAIVGDGDPFPIGATTTYRVLVSPVGTVWVASNNGLHRSSDGGTTWKRSKPGVGFANGYVRDLAMSADGNLMYAVISFNQTPSLNGLYRSQDGGSSWTQITDGLGGIDWNSRARLAIAGSNANVGYLIVDPVANNAYVTTNGGSSWSPMAFVNPAPTYGGYNLEIGVDPVDANTVYVLGFREWVNTGGTVGGGWTEIFPPHVDQHAIAFPPCSAAPCPYYLGNDGGVYQVQPQGSATSVSIQSKNTNITITEFTGGDLGINFVNDPRAIGGSQDNGTEVYVRNATSNPLEWIQSLGADGGYAYLDHNSDTPYIAYTEEQAACGPFQSYTCGVFKSDFWGYSWNSFSQGLENLTAFFYPFYLPDRADRLHLAFAANNSVYENRTASASWYRSSQDLNALPTAIAIAPSSSAVIYAGLPGGRYFNLPGVIYRTASGNSGAQSTYEVRSSGLPNTFNVNSIAVDSTSPDVVYLCGSFFSTTPQVVYKTTDGGQSWTNISGNLPNSLPAFSVITYFAGATRVIVIGTDAGVFFSTNEGVSWSALNSGLPNTKIAQLSIDRDQTTIAAFTGGRGAFFTNIDGGPSCTYAINPTNQSFPASGGSGSFNVTAPAGCTWTATPDASFITITSGGSGNGNGTVGYSVAANGPSSRSGHINIPTQSFTVNQAGANQLPVANPGGPYNGTVGVAVQFNGTGSFDPDGSITSYQWNFGDGATGSGAMPTHAYSAANTYTVLLTVTDNSGGQGSASTTSTISVGNQPPVANHGGPYSGTVGSAIQFNGSGSSDPDGFITSYQWNFGDGSSGSGVNPTHTYSVANTYTVTLTVTDNGGLQRSASTTATISNGSSSGPVGYWKFDEGSGTIAADSSDNGNTGTLTNGPVWISGRVNSALNFDGSNDYVQVGNRASLIMTTALTMSAWIKPTANTSGPHTIMNKEGEYEVSLYDGQIAWAISNSSPGWYWVFTGYSPPVGSWTHIAVTYDGSTIRTYANGIQVHSQAGNGNIVDSDTPENDFRIGNRQCGICVEPFSGGIDEVRMYNRALSAAEIQTLANPPSGNDTVWVEDNLPAGAIPAGDFEGWNWISSNPAPFSGTLSNQSNLVAGEHQHYFYGATDKLVVSTSNVMVAYVYLDPFNPPSEVMLQWNSDFYGWSHRAYWGANNIPWGTDGTASRMFIGPLPATGGWVRLEVPANLVGLEGLSLNGLAFTLWDGRATFDHAGKAGSGSGPTPVGYWKFDEGGGFVAGDSSGNGLNGSLINGPTWMAGRINSALNFDGFDDYVQVGSQPALLMTNTMTASAWIYPTAGYSTRTIVNREGEYDIGELEGVLSWAFSNTSPGWNWVSTGYSPPLFQWTHIAVTYDNGVIKTYANGVLVHTYNGSGAIVDASPPENDFRIGSRQCSFCSEYFQGSIDEVRMYNTALSAADIQALANPGGPPPKGAFNGSGDGWLFDELLRSVIGLRSTFSPRGQ